MATQSPMASDLRKMFAASKIVTDLERIADYAVDICKINKRIEIDPLGEAEIPLWNMVEILTGEVYRRALAKDTCAPTRPNKAPQKIVHRSRFPTSSFGASKPIPQKTRVAKTILTKVRAYGLIHSGTMVFAMGVFKPKIRFVASIAPCPSHLSFVILFFCFLR